MDVQELKEKYQATPMVARFAIMAVVGLAFPAYQYSEESKVVADAIQAEKSRLQSLEAKVASQRAAKAKIPDREKQLDEADQKINDIRRTLPPSFEVHEVLRRSETEAREYNVTLKRFEPQDVLSTSLYQTMPFSMAVEGRFGDVTRFLDGLVHWDTLTRIRQIGYAPALKEVIGQNQNVGVLAGAAAMADRRDRAIVTATFTLQVFKTVGL